MPRAWSAGVVVKALVARVAGGKPTFRVAGAGPAAPVLPPNVATAATPTATIDMAGSATRRAHRFTPSFEKGGGGTGAPGVVSVAAGRDVARARTRAGGSHRRRGLRRNQRQ